MKNQSISKKLIIQTKNTLLILTFTSFSLTSCQKEKSFNSKSINLQRALTDCLQKKGNDYGVMLFGDSMLDLQSSYIMSFVSNLTNTYDGLGNCNYPTKDNFINNKGAFLIPEDGAELYDVNQQNSILGRPEWAGRIGYMNSANQKVKFVTYGAFPTKVITKIFILTENVASTYDIERTTDNGTSWIAILNNATTLDTLKGMKVHVFDDTSEDKSVGYRVVWKSGQIMCLDPLFLKPRGNNIYHITVGSGGADFKLQTSIPKERIRFLIDNTNIKMITSSHRYEVSNLNEFNNYQDLIDDWWEGKNIDVIYFGQPPQTNDNTTADQLKKDINSAILKKCIAKKYLFYDMYKAMGGLQKVVNMGWGEDPVHLSHNAYATIAPDLLSYLGLCDNN